MIFVIDIGNSNIVLGLMDDQRELVFSGRIRTDIKKTDAEFMIDIKTLLDIYKVSLDGVRGCIISSVVPAVTDSVHRAMSILTGVQPMVVGTGIKTGIRIATDHPLSLGNDLVVDAVAASEEYPGTLVIFDMGTATTCSVVDEKKTYLGTMIMPGIGIAQEALTERTAQLPLIRFEKPKHMIGKNTIESMQSGLIYGNAAMVDGVIERIEEELDREVTVILTGGTARLIMPFCRKKVIYDETLLLKGLWYIYHKNLKPSERR